MKTEIKSGYAFPEKAIVGSFPYADLRELISKNPDLQSVVGYVPYVVRSIERLIQYNLEVTDCIYSIKRGSITKPIISEYADEPLANECDYIMRIENKDTSSVLDIYFGESKEDGSHELFMHYEDQKASFNIYDNCMTEEMAQYMSMLCANRTYMYINDYKIKWSSKKAVYGIEHWIHEILKRNIMPELPSIGSYGIGNVDDLLASL